MIALARRALPVALLLASVSVSGCRLRDDEPLTLGEARQALDEASLST